MIKYALKKFDRQSNDYIIDEGFWQNPRIWYKDSLAVEEIKGVWISEDSSGNETRFVSVSHFTFIDIPTRSLYDYSSFSDTARLIRKYTHPDSIPVPGGWTFYNPSKEFPGYAPPVKMSDTTISGISYQRMMIGYTDPSSPSPSESRFIAYFRCDKKDWMIFSMVKYFAEKLGCPCTRIDYVTESADLLPLSQQVEFVTGQLTAEELKVFDTWKRNAERNPVH
ncbi:MAG: hypothetical protein ABW019_10610 [Chitinophagaceae bacterium]